VSLTTVALLGPASFSSRISTYRPMILTLTSKSVVSSLPRYLSEGDVDVVERTVVFLAMEFRSSQEADHERSH